MDPPNLLCEMTPMRHYFCIQPRPSIFRAAQPFQLPGSCILTPTFACCLLAMLEPCVPGPLAPCRDRHRASARESFRARCQLRQNRAPEAICTAYRSQAEGQVEKPQLKHLTPIPKAYSPTRLLSLYCHSLPRFAIGKPRVGDSKPSTSFALPFLLP